MSRIIHSVFVAGLLILFVTSPVMANHRQAVLGDSTTSASPSLPATSDGPGFLLPDSPFFFLDTMKQNVRLFLAFSPEKKAQVHTEIAGERLAELRFMLVKNNEKGIKIALEGITENLQKSSDELSQADLQGKDVTSLAQKINEDLKTKRNLLDELENSSTGELKARVNVVQRGLLEAKLQVEDSLPEDQLLDEIEDDISHEIEDQVEDASHSARGLEHAIDILEKNASEAALKNQTKRAEALQRAIEAKNEALKKQQERASEIDKKKFELQKDEIEAAREAVKNAQEAARKFTEAKQKTNDLKESDSSESLDDESEEEETESESNRNNESTSQRSR